MPIRPHIFTIFFKWATGGLPPGRRYDTFAGRDCSCTSLALHGDFFRPLLPEEIGKIAEDAIQKIGLNAPPEAVEVVKQYCSNGREAVNMIQLAAGLALTEKRDSLRAADVEWVASSSQLQPRPDRKIPEKPQVGVVNGLAVYGPNMGLC